MGGGKFVPKKSKTRGDNSPGVYCRNKSFFCNAASQIFRQKILGKVIIVTADGKFVLKTDKITAA